MAAAAETRTDATGRVLWKHDRVAVTYRGRELPATYAGPAEGARCLVVLEPPALSRLGRPMLFMRGQSVRWLESAPRSYEDLHEQFEDVRVVRCGRKRPRVGALLGVSRTPPPIMYRVRFDGDADASVVCGSELRPVGMPPTLRGEACTRPGIVHLLRDSQRPGGAIVKLGHGTKTCVSVQQALVTNPHIELVFDMHVRDCATTLQLALQRMPGRMSTARDSPFVAWFATSAEVAIAVIFSAVAVVELSYALRTGDWAGPTQESFVPLPRYACDNLGMIPDVCVTDDAFTPREGVPSLHYSQPASFSRRVAEAIALGKKVAAGKNGKPRNAAAARLDAMAAATERYYAQFAGASATAAAAAAAPPQSH